MEAPEALRRSLSKLASLKVDQLKRACGAAGLSKGGLKGDLQRRLNDALRSDHAASREAAAEGVALAYAQAFGGALAHSVRPSVSSLATYLTLCQTPPPPPLPLRAPPPGPPVLPLACGWEAAARATLRSADAFTTEVREPLPPTLLRLAPAPLPPAGWVGPPPALTQADVVFALPACDAAAVRSGELSLYVACVLLGDAVASRLHWPCHASLTVGGHRLSVPCRLPAQDLGPQGRDPPALVPPALLTGGDSPSSLRLVLAGYDARHFAVSARLVRPRPLAEVAAEVPPAPSFAAGVAAVVAVVAASEAAAAEAGLVSGSHMCLNLKDPLTGSRLRTPVRYPACPGLACFDLAAFLQTAQRSRALRCPSCSAAGPVAALRRDAYAAAVLAALASCPDSAGLGDVGEAEVNAVGEWRVALPGGFSRWYSPAETQAAAEGTAPLPPPREGGSAPPPAAEEEVIVLSSDSEEEPPPPKRRTLSPAPPPQTAPADEAPVFRVRLAALPPPPDPSVWPHLPAPGGAFRGGGGADAELLRHLLAMTQGRSAGAGAAEEVVVLDD